MKWAASHVKISWILALALLIGCLLGANHIMNGSGRGELGPNREPPSAKSASKNASGQRYGLVADGVATSEGDIQRLIPSSVPGEVVEVLATSGEHVKKGQVLLRMDDRWARIKMEQAESAVLGAKANLKMAQTALETFPIQRNRQVQAIHAAELKRDIQKNDVNQLKDYKAKGLNYSETGLVNSIKALEIAEFGISSEEDKLKEIDSSKSALVAQVDLADSQLKTAETKLKEAKLGVEYCELKAPADGTILQSFVSVGSKFGDQAVQPAFHFYTGGLIVKANITQEFASGVKEGQSVVVEDAAGSEQTWHGHVSKVDNKFTTKREQGAIPGLPEQNQDPVLECRITLDTDKPLPLLNQKVRVKFLK
jgi:multidrug resistance efflux pump